MIDTMTWQERLFPHTFHGTDLRDYVFSHEVYTGAFDDEDRRTLKLVRIDEWEQVCFAVHHEMRNNLAIATETICMHPDPEERRLYHAVRRIVRPKRVMQFNRGRNITITI